MSSESRQNVSRARANVKESAPYSGWVVSWIVCGVDGVEATNKKNEPKVFFIFHL